MFWAFREWNELSYYQDSPALFDKEDLQPHAIHRSISLDVMFATWLVLFDQNALAFEFTAFRALVSMNI